MGFFCVQKYRISNIKPFQNFVLTILAKDDRNHLVEKMFLQELKQENQAMRSYFEKIIDAIVFELYFSDHMKEKEIDIVAKSLKIHSSEIKNRINYLHEENPMLGHRGCRLAISFPEIDI
jgi:phosphoenolpyruvate synthase/pyruvate phosphate dikinase